MQNRSTVPKRSSKQKYTTPTNRRSPVTPMKSNLPFHRIFSRLLNRAVRVELTVIPIMEFGFNLHKQVFRDALCLRYGWPLSRLPSHCVCGVPFSIDHAFSCPKGVFPIIRHNRIRYLLAELLTGVCPCVAVEPVLQPLSGESFQHRSTNTEDNARLDVCAREFCRTTAFFDVRAFNAHTPSNGSLLTIPHAIVSMKWRRGGSMREE